MLASDLSLSFFRRKVSPMAARSASTTIDQPVRRTQQQRRATTRLALLDACATSLIEDGYAGTTTTVVVERAGVSQGALFKHFPTKQALLAETAQHLYDGLLDRYVRRFQRLSAKLDPEVRLDRAIRLLWQMFESPHYGAAIDLLAASRTDVELRTRLEVVVTQHAANVRDAAAALFPDLIGHEDFAITLDLLLETMVGMAVSRIADPGAAHYRRLLQHLTELAHERVRDARASIPRTSPTARPERTTEGPT